MHPLEILDFTAADLEEAAALLAGRHRAHRVAVPALDASFEDPAAALAELETLWRGDGASGASARRDGRLVGYVVGARREDDVWGPNVWIDAPGYAVEEAETVRDLYAHAAAGWVAAGRTSHYVIVPATETEHVDAWFRLGFGHQHVAAIRDVPVADEAPPPPAGLTLRVATLEDVDALAALDVVLPAHQARAPTFSRLPLPTVEEMRKDWEESWDDQRFTTFVAEHGGTVVGSAVGCPIDVSSQHSGMMRPPGAGFLGFAAVLPEARGLGAGRMLGEAVLDWARRDGRAWVVTDWRMTNLLSSRAWPRLGFRPTFYRLHRAID